MCCYGTEIPACRYTATLLQFQNMELKSQK